MTPAHALQVFLIGIGLLISVGTLIILAIDMRNKTRSNVLDDSTSHYDDKNLGSR